MVEREREGDEPKGAEFDWIGFGAEVGVRLALAGLSTRQAVARWPDTNVTLWSRARSGNKPLSVPNFLLVCRCLRIPPTRHWSARGFAPARGRRKKAQENQGVSVPVSRGTGVPA